MTLTRKQMVKAFNKVFGEVEEEIHQFASVGMENDRYEFESDLYSILREQEYDRALDTCAAKFNIPKEQLDCLIIQYTNEAFDKWFFSPHGPGEGHNNWCPECGGTVNLNHCVGCGVNV